MIALAQVPLLQPWAGQNACEQAAKRFTVLYGKNRRCFSQGFSQGFSRFSQGFSPMFFRYIFCPYNAVQYCMENKAPAPYGKTIAFYKKQ